MQADAVEASLPPADIALCKDVLQHLSSADVDTVLTKLATFPYVVISNDVATTPQSMTEFARLVRAQVAPRSRLALMSRGMNPFRTMDLHLPENSDIAAGDCRPLDIGAEQWALRERGLTIRSTLDFDAGTQRWGGVRKRLWFLTGISNGLSD